MLYVNANSPLVWRRKRFGDTLGLNDRDSGLVERGEHLEVVQCGFAINRIRLQLKQVNNQRLVGPIRTHIYLLRVRDLPGEVKVGQDL